MCPNNIFYRLFRSKNEGGGEDRPVYVLSKWELRSTYNSFSPFSYKASLLFTFFYLICFLVVCKYLHHCIFVYLINGLITSVLVQYTYIYIIFCALSLKFKSNYDSAFNK